MHGECMANGAAEQAGCSRVEPETTEAGSGAGGRWEGERRICGDAGLWCPAMVVVLRQVLLQRQGRYPAGSSAKSDAKELGALTRTSDRWVVERHNVLKGTRSGCACTSLECDGMWHTSC